MYDYVLMIRNVCWLMVLIILDFLAFWGIGRGVPPHRVKKIDVTKVLACILLFLRTVFVSLMSNESLAATKYIQRSCNT